MRFQTLSGELRVARDGELLTMDFPAKGLEPAPEMAGAVRDALGSAPAEVFRVTPGRTLVALFDDEETVRGVRPDFGRVAELPGPVGITAPGRDSDCASRYFHPAAGVPEDPVTGSLHCALGPLLGRSAGKEIRSTRARCRCAGASCTARTGASASPSPGTRSSTWKARSLCRDHYNRAGYAPSTSAYRWPILAAT